MNKVHRFCSQNSLERVVVLDIEHTCTNNNSIPREERETIEIGAVLIDTKQCHVIDEFQSLIRPIRHRVISDFCTELTGIKQSELDKSEPFQKIFKDFLNWLPSEDELLLVTWGAYDLIQINIDCSFHQLTPFSPPNTLNLKRAYREACKLKKPVGLKKAMEISLGTFEGTHHRALDDARNTAKLFALVSSSLEEISY